MLPYFSVPDSGFYESLTILCWYKGSIVTWTAQQFSNWEIVEVAKITSAADICISCSLGVLFCWIAMLAAFVLVFFFFHSCTETLFISSHSLIWKLALHACVFMFKFVFMLCYLLPAEPMPLHCCQIIFLSNQDFMQFWPRLNDFSKCILLLYNFVLLYLDSLLKFCLNSLWFSHTLDVKRPLSCVYCIRH